MPSKSANLCTAVADVEFLLRVLNLAMKLPLVEVGEGNPLTPVNPILPFVLFPKGGKELVRAEGVRKELSEPVPVDPLPAML